MNSYYHYKLFLEVFILGDRALVNSAFLAGFVSMINFPNDLLTNPLSSCLIGGISAVVCRFFAGIVSDIFPFKVHAAIACCLIVSMIYWQIKYKIYPETLPYRVWKRKLEEKKMNIKDRMVREGEGN